MMRTRVVKKPTLVARIGIIISNIMVIGRMLTGNTMGMSEILFSLLHHSILDRKATTV